MIGAPHTSNWDFVFMLCIAWSEGLRLRWLGKKSLFAGWRRPIMRGLGGIPVDRANPAGLVDTLVSEMRADPDLVLVVTPEGTRSSGTTWRSGFYRIALAAQVPVTLGYVDRPSRTCGLGETLRLTADVSADMDRIRAFYADKSGLRPELRTEPRLSDEAGGSATTTDPDKR
ncbi:1-acyl-sn-glycerol-3-phosphate acyltransferase [Brooklawnia propionicigenes]|uniref:1-acyl-sn-glycerol-3-phosphate acyltransferase n=1 Tax=Brooklawnia propionicigenes TaxID=3041175 RepID=A0AAN0K7L6_9ACTN|nr:1-acyl-sn-glycerol-3-phosphate acyltransferase [Brooklawnia sp. SH051]